MAWAEIREKGGGHATPNVVRLKALKGERHSPLFVMIRHHYPINHLAYARMVMFPTCCDRARFAFKKHSWRAWWLPFVLIVCARHRLPSFVIVQRRRPSPGIVNC